MASRSFTALFQREGDGWVALCPELDVASQGDTIEQARVNLRETVELLLETTSETEIRERLNDDLPLGAAFDMNDSVGA